MKPVIFIAGPTASGKSAWAIKIAKKFGGEIINADALQVYKNLQILSARPALSEMQDVPHHLFGHVSGETRYSTGQWLRDVQPVILDCLARDKYPILTGGTGLYFKALLNGLAQIPEVSSDVFEDINNRLKQFGVKRLREEADQVDPIAAQRVLGDDPQRLTRIVSVYTQTGKALSEWQANTRPIVTRQFCLCAVLLPERTALYDRINSRFGNMVDKGGLTEAEAVFSKNYDASLPVMKAIGVQQLHGYFNGKVSLDDAIELAKRDTRRFAKRQYTWFRGQARDWTQITMPEQRKQFESLINAASF